MNTRKVYRIYSPSRAEKPYLTGMKRIWPEADGADGPEEGCEGPKEFRQNSLCPEGMTWASGEPVPPCHTCERYKFSNTWGAQGKIYLSKALVNRALERAKKNGESGVVIEVLRLVREEAS